MAQPNYDTFSRANAKNRSKESSIETEKVKIIRAQKKSIASYLSAANSAQKELSQIGNLTQSAIPAIPAMPAIPAAQNPTTFQRRKANKQKNMAIFKSSIQKPIQHNLELSISPAKVNYKE